MNRMAHSPSTELVFTISVYIDQSILMCMYGSTSSVINVCNQHITCAEFCSLSLYKISLNGTFIIVHLTDFFAIFLNRNRSQN